MDRRLIAVDIASLPESTIASTVRLVLRIGKAIGPSRLATTHISVAIQFAMGYADVMARTESSQLNIRSRFARDRVASLARDTGMTATQVVEEALRAYVPQPPDPVPAGFIRRGHLLIKTGGKRVSLEDANAMLDEARLERG